MTPPPESPRPSSAAWIPSVWVGIREEYRNTLASLLTNLDIAHELRREIQELEFQKAILQLLLAPGPVSLGVAGLDILQAVTQKQFDSRKERRDATSEVQRLRGELDRLKGEWASRHPDLAADMLIDIDPEHCILNFDLCGSTSATTAIHDAVGLSGVQQFKDRFKHEIKDRLAALKMQDRCRLEVAGDEAWIVFEVHDDLIEYLVAYSAWLRRTNASASDPRSPGRRWYRFGASSGPVRYASLDATSLSFSPAKRLQDASAPGTLLIDDRTYGRLTNEANRDRFKPLAERVQGKETDPDSIPGWYWVVDADAASEVECTGRWRYDPKKCAVPRDALRLGMAPTVGEG